MNWILKYAWLVKKVYMFGRQLFMILGYCRARLLLLDTAGVLFFLRTHTFPLSIVYRVLVARLICSFSTDVVCAR